MNYDNTSITIRERDFAELLDLGLRVAWSHAGGLLLALAAGAAPWALLNGVLLYQFTEETFWGDPSAYLLWLTLLMALEAPIATAPITLYLGQVMFFGRADAGRIAGDFFRCLPQMLLMQGVVRCLTAALLLLPLMMPYVMWPYLSELILLERTPLWLNKRRKQANQLSTSRRSKNLHRGVGGDLFARWMASLAAGGVLLIAAIGGLHQAMSVLGGFTMSNALFLLLAVPLGGWLVVGFFAVVRFLAYLDLRIRREGWEVELKMRAEAAKIVRTAL